MHVCVFGLGFLLRCGVDCRFQPDCGIANPSLYSILGRLTPLCAVSACVCVCFVLRSDTPAVRIFAMRSHTTPYSTQHVNAAFRTVCTLRPMRSEVCAYACNSKRSLAVTVSVSAWAKINPCRKTRAVRSSRMCALVCGSISSCLSVHLVHNTPHVVSCVMCVRYSCTRDDLMILILNPLV